MQAQKRHWSAREVASKLGMAERTIRRHIKAGRLEAPKPGKSYIITRSALVDYLGEEQVNDIFGSETAPRR